MKNNHLTSDQARLERLKDEIVIFETFFFNLGFKRSDGAIFGVLMLSDYPMTSCQIEAELNLSQSAISLGLKVLMNYGAIATSELREGKTKHTKMHTVKADSLSIVASLFRKRELEMVNEFKMMADRVLYNVHDMQDQHKKKTITKRMNSILTTCSIADSIMGFIFNLSKHPNEEIKQIVANHLEKSLALLINTPSSIKKMSSNITHYWKHICKDNESSLQE